MFRNNFKKQLGAKMIPMTKLKRPKPARKPPPEAIGDFEWIDITGVGKSLSEFKLETEALYNKMQSTPAMKRYCYEPEALPKYMKDGEQVLIIMRLSTYHTIDDLERLKLTTWSVSELTNRYTIMVDYDKKLITTMHAHEVGFTEKVKKKYMTKGLTVNQFKWMLMHMVIRDNEQSIHVNKKLFDESETSLVLATHNDETARGLSKNIYSVMRRCSVNRMMLGETYNLLRDMQLDHPRRLSSLITLEEHLRQSLFYIEEIHTSSKDLLSLHFGTAAHRTNDLVRLLTLLNAIFIPLSFIAGFYGMNFDYMPGLTQPIEGVEGVWLVGMFMIVVSSGLMFWFKVKGWL
eukprot:TRINITY_DN1510_c0_g2_i1.p1 TRINITY_DN1510_c0_g2~~TRINITY_DN1510_c0_g2_i1.p1  ORF type:complete len:371 (+),score=62.36 TRINITY_DN1510_c0_g2_i1:75-1115(+)